VTAKRSVKRRTGGSADAGRRVIVVGAGPAGLTAAMCLAAQEVPVLVLEAEPSLTLDLRAGSYHPPTLEMLAPYGVAARMHEEGIVVRKWQIRDRGEGVIGEFDLGLLGDETPYPYRLHLEQHKLTPILLAQARSYPDFAIRFSTRVIGATQSPEGVRVTIDTPGGLEDVAGAYLVGADGHHSAVRAAMGVDFAGFTWPEVFLIVSTTYDFEPHGFAYASYTADPAEWVMLFKVPGFNPPALWRLAFPADPERPREETMDLATVERRLQGVIARAEPYDIVHRNAYRVHQRVAATFNRGRFAIAGDAAHVNNPLGGMGLNGSVHDAVNLAEKLVRIWRGEAGSELLDRYTRQRRPAQIEYVQEITIRNKRLVEERDPEVRRRHFDEIRATAADPKRARAYLMDTSMINSVRRAEAID
jgi:3-(3-hydroxy-phenyl)propionate hydroxylase